MMLRKKEKVSIIIQARMGSRRLPGKVLMNFDSDPMLLFLVNRLKKQLPYKIYVATTTNKEDDAIESLCVQHHIEFFRGDTENVFQRFKSMVNRFAITDFVRLTGDNPLIDTELIEYCIDIHVNTSAALTTTREVLHDGTINRFFPKGMSVDIINTLAVNSIDEQKLSEFDKEHIIPAFFKNNLNITLVKNNLNRKFDIDSYSIDTKDDYDNVLTYYLDVKRQK